MSTQTPTHVPVLLTEVIDVLSPQKGQTFLDLTAGYGGHSAAVIDIIGQESADLVDRDQNAVNVLTKKFPYSNITKQSFANFVSDTTHTFDMILADIGISSPHVDDPDRGFSFRTKGPLDMRMDQSQAFTAEILINTYTSRQLADIFWKYAEEKQSRRYADLIVANRPFKDTTELAELIASNSPYSKKHPATKVFQALRIEVNQELKQLEILLTHAPKLLRPQGRLAIISFHSLEDRMVKKAFAEIGQDTYDSEFRVLTKKPVVPSPPELDINPRARSAKLRALLRK